MRAGRPVDSESMLVDAKRLSLYLRIASWALALSGIALAGIFAWRGGDLRENAGWLSHVSTLLLAAIIVSILNVCISFAARRRPGAAGGGGDRGRGPQGTA